MELNVIIMKLCFFFKGPMSLFHGSNPVNMVAN